MKSKVFSVKDTHIKRLVFAALLAALVCVATMVIQIPSPANGYVNLGDCFVLLSGWILGPWYGAAAAGIGSMLADLFLGYAYYAPGTLVIKGCMGLVTGLCVYRANNSTIRLLLSGVAAELWMVGGYCFYAALLLGEGSGALLSIPGNLMQGLAGLVVGFILMKLLHKSKALEKIKLS